MLLQNWMFMIFGFGIQQIFASRWTDAASFSSPNNTNTHCSPSQRAGYDWAGLGIGPFTSYGSNSFTGFSCHESFHSHDVLKRSDFRGKCITAELTASPSMSCDNEDAFSISHMQISSSHEVEVECRYAMPDGSLCVQMHNTSRSGSVLSNVQCGGR